MAWKRSRVRIPPGPPQLIKYLPSFSRRRTYTTESYRSPATRFRFREESIVLISLGLSTAVGTRQTRHPAPKPFIPLAPSTVRVARISRHATRQTPARNPTRDGRGPKMTTPGVLTTHRRSSARRSSTKRAARLDRICERYFTALIPRSRSAHRTSWVVKVSVML